MRRPSTLIFGLIIGVFVCLVATLSANVCYATDVSGTISTNTTWKTVNSPFRVISNITVAAGATLTIEPGVIIQFNDNVGMWVDGTLQAKGTAGSPITFTGTTEAADWWRAIFVQNAGVADLQWATIRYGGYYEGIGLDKTGTGDLSLTNSTISNTRGTGLQVASSGPVTLTTSTFTANSHSGLSLKSGPVTATGCTFSSNGLYGLLQTINESIVYADNIFSDNPGGGVGVEGGTMGENITWQPAGNPFRILGNITVAADVTLTIEPGGIIQFNDNLGMWVDGTLQAKGSAGSPITFTGTTETIDWWRAIFVQNAGSAILDWCDIGYAGYYEGAGILKTGTGSLSLQNSILHHHRGDGLRISAGASSFTSANNTFHTNNFGVSLGIDISFDDNSSDFHSNNVDLFSGGGTISTAVIWNLKPAYSLLVNSNITIQEGASLTVKPGTVVKFNDNIGLWVNGRLNAQGLATAPIYFTDWRDDNVGGDANGDSNASASGADWWRAIFVQNAGVADLQWATIRYGGYYEGIGLDKTGTGDLSLTNSTISNTRGTGLRLSGSSGNHAISRSTFSLNQTGIHVLNQTTPVSINGNQILGNSSYGILNQGSAEVDGRHTWWGHSSGPKHTTLNPNGEGDTVSNGVLFEPWSTNPATGAILAPLRSGTLVQGDTLRFLGSAFLAPATGYAWDFGADRTSSQQNPGLVNFPNLGTHQIILSYTYNNVQDPAPDRRAFNVVSDNGAYPDLRVSNIVLPTSLAIGQSTTITYTAQNSGPGAMTGVPWKDTLYFSRDPYLDADDTWLSTVSMNTTVASGSSYQGAITATLPAAVEGANYLILSLNDEWHVVEQHRLNNERAIEVNVMIPALESGINKPVSFNAGQVEHYFKVSAPGSQNLLLNLNLPPGLEAYVRYGALPTRSTYDYRFTDSQFSLPNAMAGDWYILIYGTTQVAGEYSIQYFAANLALTGVFPGKLSTLSDIELLLSGAGFMTPLDVKLIAADNAEFTPDSVEIDSFTQAAAFFSAGSLPAGTYKVRISRNGDTSELSSALEIIDQGEAKLETRLILPAAFGYHGLATVYVEYKNVGNAPMPAPLLLVTAAQKGQERALMTLDQTRLSSGFWTSAIPAGFSNSVQFLASGEKPGMLQPGESRRVPVYYAGWQTPWDFSYPPFEWNVGVLDANNTTPVAWADMKNGMRPAYVNQEAWDVVWHNFTSLVGPTWGDYVAMLSRNALYLYRQGQRVDDIEPLLSMAFRQADGLSPLSTLATGIDAVIEAPGLPITFERSYGQPISRRFELGALGRGWTHNWQYKLTTEDDGTVVITDMTGTPRLFQPDSRYANRYLAQPGDQGALRFSSATGYILTESNGLIQFFSADGQLNYIEDTNGNRITCTYSGGLLTSLTHSAGPAMTITYTNGLISSVADHLNRQTKYTYNDQHLASVTTYDGQITTYTYNVSAGTPALHGLTKTRLPDGTHRFFTYDDQGRLATASRDNDNEKTAFSYSDGRVNVTDALSHTNRFFFDYAGRLVKGENALGEAQQMSFDELGNLVGVTDPAGISTRFTYDRKGNLTELSDAMHQKTTFTHTSTYNRLASVTDAKGNRSVYGYDSKGNLSSVAYPDGSAENWAYDSQGNAITWSNRRQHPIKYAYDAQGRIIDKTYADASSITYTYDTRGNLKTAVDSQGAMNFTYNAKDWLTRINYPGNRYLAFTYDGAGRRKSSKDQLEYQVNYEYNDAGRLSRLSDGANTDIVVYVYDTLGRLTRKTMGNGVYAVYAYDAADRLLSLINHKPNNAILSRFAYTYDSRGRRTSMTTHYGVWTYSYDDLGQLTRAILTSTNSKIADQDLSYEYDAMGNRIKTVENGKTEAYKENSLNQVVEAGDRTYTYDADGNLVQETGPDGTTIYSYNDENRMIGVTKGGDTWQYTYDALDNRVAIDENGSVTHYVVDPIGLGNTVGEYAADGALITRYTHGFSLLNRKLPSGLSDYYTFDPMGNTSELTGSAGVLRNAYAYQPFGRTLLANQTVPNPFRFVGALGVMADATGLHYMRARHYDSQTGRFTARDPIGLAGGDVNLYRYVMNFPSGLIDPTGLAPSDDVFEYIEGLEKYKKEMGEGATKAAHAIPKAIGNSLISWTGGAVASIGVGALATQAITGIVVFSNPVTAGLIVGGTLVALAPDALSWAASKWDRWRNPPTKIIPPTKAATRGDSGSAGSQDPNQKTTVSGYGSNNFVDKEQLLLYRIDFENHSKALAPAQVVQISDPLSASLDWSTFEITEIGFGSVMIPVPSGNNYFKGSVDYTYTDEEYNLDIEVQVEVWIENGTVYANFFTIDPITGLPPDVKVGFLMPENETGRGQGHIGYAVKPVSGIATGTAIRNVATIQFDFSLAIDTNQVDPLDKTKGTDPAKEALVTFDLLAPKSAMNALAPIQPNRNFTVSWSGSDGSNGSGIRSYDVYIKDNTGSWDIWLQNTTEESATYTGENGHLYSFYVTASDNVGNQEIKPAVLETKTRITLPTLTVIQAGGDTPMINADGCLLNWLDNIGTCTADQGTAITLAANTAGKFDWIGWSAPTGSITCDDKKDCSFTLGKDSSVTGTFDDSFPWPIFLPAILKASPKL